ncbi:signal peptidase II [Candidatus Woesearchaeota archaeon]|nr:signal peptidase II [Candidatus Woesearchaeota archaeon]
MVRKHSRTRISLLIILSVFFFDQLTKLIVRITNPKIDLYFFKLVFVKNTGSAFGLLQGQNTFLIFLSLMFVGGLLFFFDKVLLEKDYYAYALIFVGAVSNLFDRVFLGFVTDMISFGWFPVFNVADSSISVGAAIILFFLVKDEFLNKKKK